MKRSLLFTGAVSAALILVAAGLIWQRPFARPEAPSLNEALQLGESGMPTRLFSGALDQSSGRPLEVKDKSYEVVRNGRRVASFILFKDSSTRDTFYMDDGQGISFVREYYPLQATDVGRRIKGLVTYLPDGATVRSEIWWRANGSRERVGHLLDRSTGRYETIVLYPDSDLAQSSKVTVANPYANNFEPKLVIEQRWHSGDRHTLSYVDLLNDDGTRDQTTFDENEQPIMTKHIGRWGKVGTKVKFFFPGTDKVRLESSTEAAATIVTCYRLDGTVVYKQLLNTYSKTTTYFDESGTNPLFEQSRWKNNVVENGKPVEDWPVFKVVEYDRAAVKREFSWRNGSLDTETLYNVTVNGLRYDKVIRTFRPDGTLMRVDMLGRKVEKVTLDFTVEQNVRADVPAAFMVRPEERDEIPIPDARAYERD